MDEFFYAVIYITLREQHEKKIEINFPSCLFDGISASLEVKLSNYSVMNRFIYSFIPLKLVSEETVYKPVFLC